MRVRQKDTSQERLVLGFDITDSTKHDTDWWVDMRKLVLPAVFKAVRSAGVRRWQYAFRDAGDGGAIVFTRQEPRPADVIDGIIPAVLRVIQYRRPVGLLEPLRLRFALHSGPVARDRWGYVGEGVFHMFRILDSNELVTQHAENDAAATLTVSNTVYQELQRTSGFTAPPGMIILDPQAITKRPPNDWQPAQVVSMGGTGQIHLPPASK